MRWAVSDVPALASPMATVLPPRSARSGCRCPCARCSARSFRTPFRRRQFRRPAGVDAAAGPLRRGVGQGDGERGLAGFSELHVLQTAPGGQRNGVGGHPVPLQQAPPAGWRIPGRTRRFRRPATAILSGRSSGVQPVAGGQQEAGQSHGQPGPEGGPPRQQAIACRGSATWSRPAGQGPQGRRGAGNTRRATSPWGARSSNSRRPPFAPASRSTIVMPRPVPRICRCAGTARTGWWTRPAPRRKPGAVVGHLDLHRPGPVRRSTEMWAPGAYLTAFVSSSPTICESSAALQASCTGGSGAAPSTRRIRRAARQVRPVRLPPAARGTGRSAAGPGPIRRRPGPRPRTPGARPTPA